MFSPPRLARLSFAKASTLLWLLTLVSWLLSLPCNADMLLTTVSSKLDNQRYQDLPFEDGNLSDFGLEMIHSGTPYVKFPVGPGLVGITQRKEVASLTVFQRGDFAAWNSPDFATNPLGGLAFHFDGISGFLKQSGLPFNKLFVTGSHAGIAVESLFTPPDGISFVGTPHSWSAVEFVVDDWHQYPDPVVTSAERVTLSYTLRFYSAVPEPPAAVMLLPLVLIGGVRNRRHN